MHAPDSVLELLSDLCGQDAFELMDLVNIAGVAEAGMYRSHNRWMAEGTNVRADSGLRP